MIVTCPSCEAKYRVDAAALEKRRGKVKCANCAHVWTVEDEALTLSEPVVAPEPAPAPEPQPAPELQPSLRDKPHTAIRARQDANRRKARLAAEGAGWAGVAACLVVLLGGAVFFRVDVVEVWPRTAGAYAAVGLEVNPYGVEIEGLSARFEVSDDSNLLLVSGAVRNITGSDRDVPALEAIAFDEEGHQLASWPIALEAPSLIANNSANFEAALPGAPDGAVRVEVVVAG